MACPTANLHRERGHGKVAPQIGETMKALSIAFLFAFAIALQGSENLERARQLEASGDGAEALTLLAHAALSAPNDIAALTEYAEFLDCHADPAAMEAYGKLL